MAMIRRENRASFAVATALTAVGAGTGYLAGGANGAVLGSAITAVSAPFAAGFNPAVFQTFSRHFNREAAMGWAATATATVISTAAFNFLPQ